MAPARDDRGSEKRPYTPRANRDDARPAGRFSDRKFGDLSIGLK
jgi:23S rRNA pseudouridine2605 synthase